MNIYLRIKEMCEQKNISVPFLEKECGIGTKTISKWSASSPSVDKLEKIADYFGVSVDYITGRTEHALDKDINALLSDPARRALLKSTAKLSKEDIEFVSRIVENIGERKSDD